MFVGHEARGKEAVDRLAVKPFDAEGIERRLSYGSSWIVIFLYQASLGPPP
jgi:hypothetical protein